MTTFKICVIGPHAVGKSSLILRYIRDTFYTPEPTIGSNYFCATTEIDDKKVRMAIWDTAGQERFSSIIPIYTRGAHIIIYCLCNPDVNEFQKDWNKICHLFTNAVIYICITQIDKHEINEFVQIADEAHNLGCEIVYTSALSGYGISKLFKACARRCLEQQTINEFLSTPIEIKHEYVDNDNNNCTYNCI